ncbi:ribonuclease H-like domain-containing protein [Stenotrophomonas mori]|uniref:Ribonuclease H-like domain-containing protein n=1 Tax=Stenotrophomonas mori TaxID=2871096 RepID=A0ABT0SL82_9GAMM|nr:ribonuclease H-like domain-containing protein [Stenotrophomonas mori]MCL7715873.1 ribonuclease H-like domain-containing protein [Stenotrophomonas mori]
MSISLDKLKALRRQAGQPVAVAAAPAADAHTGAACAGTGGGDGAASPMPVPGDAAAVPERAGPDVIGHRPPTGTGHPLPSSPPTAGEGARRPASAEHDRSVLDWVEREARSRPPAANQGHASGSVQARSVDALQRLLATRHRVAAAPRIARDGPPDRALPGTEIAPGLHLIEAFIPQPIPSGPLSLAFSRRPDEAVQPHDLLFFDTETTGLAGGTGTRAFMIGAADWRHDGQRGEGLRVRQLLISTMAAERTMLDTFAGWLSPTTVLSSYNGRCYDAPLLKTRYRLARRGDPISPLDHVDLLFPTRRRYRGTWENCRLATIERRLLRILREDDLPGSEAPAAWLDYLRGGSARTLRRVGDHNHQDVVTLAQLFLHLVQADADERAAPVPVP